MSSSPHRYAGKSLYKQPSPELVAKIWAEYGFHVVEERWFWMYHDELLALRKIGDQRLGRAVAA